MNADVLIQPKDQLKVRVQCSSGVAYEIAEHFSFFVPGYKFMPLYKAGRWDGKIKMFDVRNREFYRGLLPRLTEWLEENAYTFDFEDKAAMRPQVPYDPSWLNRWSEYGKLEPKPHQVKAINAGLGLNQALIMSPTGSGKSYIMYMMVRYLLETTDQDILITVPTTSLVEQLYKDFDDYSVDWSAEENCQMIYSGKEKNTNHRVKISTWQSIYKLDKKWFSGFGAYLCDEAHGADAKSISGIVDKLSHAPVRIGLTGTLDGTVLHELEMLARFGPVVKATTTAELMKSGDLSSLTIRCLRLQYSPDEIKYVKGLEYQQEIDFLISHEMRNRVLVNAALNEPKNTLMLFNYIDKHGVVLYDLLKKKAEKFGKKIYYISGSVAVDEREQIRAILEKEDNCILLASMGTFSTGINVKNLHTIIFCHPYKARIKTLQSIGRGLRTMAGKDGATLIDIADDLVHTTRKGAEKLNTTMKHFIERLKVYQSEQFPYKIIPVPLFH